MRLVLLVFLMAVVLPLSAQIVLPEHATNSFIEWNEKRFSGSTTYQLQTLDDLQVVKAVSDGTASGLYLEKRIDLLETPYLSWKWRIENRLNPANERSRDGDDYAARVYVIVDGGILFWKTRALSYVWSASEQPGAAWDNAFAGSNVRMLAVRSADDPVFVWRKEKRNVLLDLKQAFGAEIRYIDAVAIMTDTDNTRGSATAYYADITFTPE